MLYTCGQCGELAVEGDRHRCMNLPWGNAKAKNGVPQRETLQIKTSGSRGLRIQKKAVVDWESVHTQFNQLKAQYTTELAKPLPPNAMDAQQQVPRPPNYHGTPNPPRLADDPVSPVPSPAYIPDSPLDMVPTTPSVSTATAPLEDRIATAFEAMLTRSFEKYFRDPPQSHQGFRASAQ